jgi:hypothetical protein
MIPHHFVIIARHLLACILPLEQFWRSQRRWGADVGEVNERN